MQSFSTSRGRAACQHSKKVTDAGGRDLAVESAARAQRLFEDLRSKRFPTPRRSVELPLIRKGLGGVLGFDRSRGDVAAPLSRADSHFLAEGAREGGLIAEAGLNGYVRNRRGRLPK
jgi:hypothetical protein